MRIKIYSLIALLFLFTGIFNPVSSFAQTELSLTATASQSGGGVTIYGPTNYNDNVITTWNCSGGAPTPWGWVYTNGTITYTWGSAVTFNKIVFNKADRPMSSCTIQWWDGTTFQTLSNYSSTICPDDSISFSPITTTILQFVNCAGSSNPNFREIQVWQTGPLPPTITGNTTVCQGGTLNLTASSTAPGPTFHWTGPNSFSSNSATISIPNMTSTQAGAYSCVVTSASLPSQPTTVNVVVNAAPNVPTIGNNGPLCVGNTLNLTNFTLLAGATYAWTGPNNYSSTVANPTITNITTNNLGTYNLIVTGSNGCSSLSPATTTVVIFSPPTITLQPFSASICPGGNATITLNAVGTNLVYQWQENSGSGFSNLSNSALYNGVGTNTLSLINAPLSMAGRTYRCIISGTCNLIDTSNAVTLTVFSAPTIVASPASDTVCESAQTSFHVNATGSSLQYQWQVNSGAGFVNLINGGGTSGVYTSTLNIIFVPYTMNGYKFRCIVSAGGCNPFLTTDSASMTVRALPNVITQPTANATCINGNATYTVSGVGYGLAFQWQVDNGSGFTNISNSSTYSGATDSILVITGVTNAMNNYNYRCVLTGLCASTAYTNSVPLIITNPPSASFTAAGSTSICPGDSLLLLATQNINYNYQWTFNNNNIAGATNPNYAAHNAGTYNLVVSIGNGNCSTTATAITVAALPAPISTLTAAGPTTFCQGNAVTLNGNTGAGLSYTWYLNNSIISGASASSYSANVSGTYVLSTFNGSCHTNSSSISVTVNPTPTASILYTGTGYFCAGSSVLLPANIGIGLSYQWYAGNTAVTGATANSYTTSAAGTYKVVVSNASGCSDTSTAVTLTSAPVPPTTITASGPTTVCAGNTVTLSAPVGSNLTYQWNYFNGTQITGATNPTYAASTSNTYTVTVTNLNGQGCAATSAPITVTVNNNPLPAASITYSGNPVICFGDSLKLNANTGTGYSYKWTVNTNLINGATAASYTAHNSGNYYVTITDNNGCIGVSSIIAVTADTPINPTVYRVGNILNTGTTYTTYQWYINGSALGGANSYTYNTNGIPGNYTVKVTDSIGCSKVSVPKTIVGIHNLSATDNDVTIYPNPATTVVFIDSKEVVNVSIISIQGKVIIHKDAAKEINLNQLPNGIYIIQVYDQNNLLLKAERFIKNSQ